MGISQTEGQICLKQLKRIASSYPLKSLVILNKITYFLHG
ncbi:hypothetical protein B4102_2386 [Heyndrickxia sporothermodurans]|uniref:Uncharacterized protein n=1 Tax=Heyndrickxia sporothermodurans TaxID=46224 RepID=A0A150LCA9_9BACI|nr:hypothetical protein B4102_2386 [Heyndrickxia sporothermodurans]